MKWLWLAIVVSIFVQDATASHNRFSTFSWSRDKEDSLTVDFVITTGWRVGWEDWTWNAGKTTFQDLKHKGANAFNFGDGSPPYMAPYEVKSKSGSGTNDWMLGTFEISHTYKTAKAYKITVLDGCCRIVDLKGGNDHEDTMRYKNYGVLDLSPKATQLFSPPTAGLPIIIMEKGKANEFNFTPPNYPFPTSLQIVDSANSGMAVAKPPGLTVAGMLIKWTVPATQALGLYSVQMLVVVGGSTGELTSCEVNGVPGRCQDNKSCIGTATSGHCPQHKALNIQCCVTSAVAVDFLIEVKTTGTSPPAPVFVDPVPKFEVDVGQTITFKVRSIHTDKELHVQISHSVWPREISFSDCEEGLTNTFSSGYICTRTFKWTPSKDQSLPLSFLTVDTQGLQSSPLQVSIKVNFVPGKCNVPSNFACPANFVPSKTPVAQCRAAKCTHTECCESAPGKCVQLLNKCPAKQQNIAGANGKECAQPTCTVSECCEPRMGRCNDRDFNCPSNMHMKQPVFAGECQKVACIPTECCDLTMGACGRFTCPPNMHKKPNTSALCGSPVCDERECCDITMGSCNRFTCPPSMHKKDRLPNLCGMPDCQEVECCDLTMGACRDHQCPAPLVPRSNAIAKCADVTCRHDECCQLSCLQYQCPFGSTLTRAASRTLCASQGQCSPQECCVPMCDGFTCPPLSVPKPNPGGIACISVNGCDLPTCCVSNPKCNTHTCEAGFMAKPNPFNIQCQGPQCNTRECCDESCGRFTCPAQMVLKDRPGSVRCGPQGCQFLDCCDTTCASLQCAALSHEKDNSARIACRSGPCAQSTCCNRNDNCGSYRCPTTPLPGFQLVPQASGKTCQAKTCVQQECCEPAFPKCVNFECPPTMVSSFPTKICASKQGCTLVECCKERGTCSQVNCDATAVKNPSGPQLCKTDRCTGVECCVMRAKCQFFTCPGSNKVKLNPGALCAGMACSEFECGCDDVKPTCQSFGCPQTMVQKTDNPLGVVCNTPKPYACTEQICCQNRDTCPNFQCPTGYRVTALFKLCGRQCAVNDCCEALASCRNHMCSASYIAKPSASNSYCTGTQACQDPECCDERDICAKSIKCNVAVERERKTPVTCGVHCKQEECCVTIPLCSLFSCPSPSHQAKPQPPAGPIQCAGDACDVQSCCDELPTCASYTCPATHRPKVSPPPCPLAGCADDNCCFVPGRCKGFSCQSSPLQTYNTTICQEASCTQGECCVAPQKMSLSLEEANAASDNSVKWYIPFFIFLALLLCCAAFGVLFYKRKNRDSYVQSPLSIPLQHDPYNSFARNNPYNAVASPGKRPTHEVHASWDSRHKSGMYEQSPLSMRAGASPLALQAIDGKDKFANSNRNVNAFLAAPSVAPSQNRHPFQANPNKQYAPYA